MGEDQRRQRCGSGEDRISGLPDELLQEILVRLGSAHAAARTSVLSRRWRHVWAHLPELRFVAPPPAAAAPASFMDNVDTALGGYLGPTLQHLGVSIVSTGTDQQGRRDLCIPAGRIAPWLHFAAEHVVGELYLYFCLPQCYFPPESSGAIAEEEAVVLELPPCERAKRIELYLRYAYATWLRPLTSGLFAALTSLRISCYVRMVGSDVTALVSTQCPCLADLNLFIQLIVNFDVFMHSNSLHTLTLRVLETRRLEVVAPRLEEITIYDSPKEAHISAPKLVKVAWHGAYDPRLHRFVDVGRTLQLLTTFYRASSLTKRFDEVDELKLHISLDLPDVARYGSLNETNKLPKCKSITIFLSWEPHGLVPIVLHLLRSCRGTKKVRVRFFGGLFRPVMYSCPPSCLCRLEESRKIDAIDLSSIEEVEITRFAHSHEQMELVEFVSCNSRILKRLVIISDMCFPMLMEVREKVRSMCHPNVKIEFYGFLQGRQVPLD